MITITHAESKLRFSARPFAGKNKILRGHLRAFGLAFTIEGTKWPRACCAQALIQVRAVFSGVRLALAAEGMPEHTLTRARG